MNNPLIKDIISALTNPRGWFWIVWAAFWFFLAGILGQVVHSAVHGSFLNASQPNSQAFGVTFTLVVLVGLAIASFNRWIKN